MEVREPDGGHQRESQPEQIVPNKGPDGGRQRESQPEQIVPNKGPEPKTESTTTKRKQLDWEELEKFLIIWLTKAGLKLKDAYMWFSKFSTDLVEFMSKHAHIFVAGLTKRSRMIIRDTVTPTYALKFVNPLKQPIYTKRNLTDKNSQPLEVHLIDIRTGEICSDPLLSALQVEIGVLDGDFCPDDQYGQVDWTFEVFSASIVGPRKQKGPLLVSIVEKKLVKWLENGKVLFADLVFTDNSTVAKNKMFRLGVWVVQHSGGPRILEGWTEEVRVRDCRGEERAKHEIPFFDDDVWRLMNIGKDGKYHGKLVSIGIKTVQDLLNSIETNPQLLKSALGLSEKKCKETIANARRAFLYRGEANMSNSEENENQMNPVPQVLITTENTKFLLSLIPTPHSIEEIPLENMDISQQMGTWTNLEFFLEDLCAGSTLNEGEATLQEGAGQSNSEEWADGCLRIPESLVET